MIDRDALANENIDLVPIVIRSMRLLNSSNRDDVYSDAMFGLTKAVIGFNSCLGFKFSTYADRKIRGEIREGIRHRRQNERLVTVDVDSAMQAASSKCSLRQSRECVREMVTNIGLTAARTIELHFVDGLSFSEISVATGLTRNGIFQGYQRAIKKLRKHLACRPLAAG